jgi:hypothetical protein
MQYNKNKKMKPIDIICKIITYYYKDMENKPMKQTILDSIHLLRFYNGMNANIFLRIATFDNNNTSFINYPLVVDDNSMLILMMRPSNYSLLNYTLDNGPNDWQPLNIMQNHLIVAHYLGLYYEGILPNITITDLFSPQTDDLKNNFKLSNNNGKQPYHYFYQDVNTRNIMFQNNGLPLPLNFIILNTQQPPLDYSYKTIFYNIKNTYFCLPSKHMYAMFLIKKIDTIQKKIKYILSDVNTILTNLLKGNIKKLQRDLVI